MITVRDSEAITEVRDVVLKKILYLSKLARNVLCQLTNHLTAPDAITTAGDDFESLY